MPKELKNVLIVGASSAGAPLARALEKSLPPSHRVVLVDAQAFAFYPVAALRAAVVPGWEDKVIAPLDGFFRAGSRHVCLPSTRVVELGKGEVVVDRANEAQGFGTTIPFQICVIATGSTYGAPMRVVAPSIEAAKDSVRALQREIQAAERVCLVGGGTVGIELAGEILAKWPGKQVTLIQSGKRLLNDDWSTKLSDRLAADLKSLGAKVLLNTRVTAASLAQRSGTIVLGDGQSIVADLIIPTTGTKPNSQLVAVHAPKAVDARGFVKVDQHLKVASSDGPFAPSPDYTYYAAGDVADSPGGPTAIAAANDAGALAKTILALATDPSSTPTSVPAPMRALLVPVGPNKGRGQMPMVGTVGPFMTRLIKGKELFVPKWRGVYA